MASVPGYARKAKDLPPVVERIQPLIFEADGNALEIQRVSKRAPGFAIGIDSSIGVRRADPQTLELANRILDLLVDDAVGLET